MLLGCDRALGWLKGLEEPKTLHMCCFSQLLIIFEPHPNRCFVQVFNSLNSLELKSLEEPRYLLGEFVKHPLACLTLASFLTTNSGDVARRHIQAKAQAGLAISDCG